MVYNCFYFRITPLKPPGGDCHLTVGGLTDSDSGDDLSVSDMKISCRVTQPPGGSSVKIFSPDADADVTPLPAPAPAKPYRYTYN